MLYQQGEQDLLELFFRGANPPSDFKLGLLNTSYVANKTHTMADIVAYEVAAYDQRIPISRDQVGWPSSALSGGDWQIATDTIVLVATAPWPQAAGFMFLMSGGSATPGDQGGRLIAVGVCSPSRQLLSANDEARLSYHLVLRPSP